MLGLTGLSTATLTLRSYGHGEYAWPLIGVVGAGTVVYTYLYTEGGVWNQVSRDRQDLSTNYAGPGNKIDDTIIGAAVFAANEGRPPNEEELEAIHESVDMVWQKYRDGIPEEELE